MSARRRNALLLFLISTARFPLIPRPLYIDSSWIKKKNAKNNRSPLRLQLRFTWKAWKFTTIFPFRRKPQPRQQKQLFSKASILNEKTKNKKSRRVKWWICCQYNKNAIPYHRFSEWKNALYSGNMYFYNHFVVNNFSRTIYKVAVFWRKNSNLEKKREILQTIQNRILLQFFSKTKSCKLF